MTHQDAVTMIEYIRKTGKKLNEWEESFMNNIQASRYPVLSYKQHIALEKIYAKATGGGVYQGRQRI